MIEPTPDDLQAMCDVLGDGTQPLSRSNVADLRRIIGPFHSKAAKMSVEQLVRTGYFLIGLYAPAEWGDPVILGGAEVPAG